MVTKTRIPIKRKGSLTKLAVDLGYINTGEHVADIPNTKIDDFAIDVAEKIKPKTAFGKFIAIANLQKNTNPSFSRKMRKGADAIAKEFSEELKPKAAIRANLKRGKNKRGKG